MEQALKVEGTSSGTSELSAGLGLAPQTDNGQMFVQALANRVCQHLPHGWELCLRMEWGAAWVTLHNQGEDIELPDSAGKSIEKQVNDALSVARGW